MALPTILSRRQFLRSTSGLAGAAYLKLLTPALVGITQSACSAKRESAQFKVLTAREARDFAAIAARILPTTDTPGANEAGVVYFFDNAFASVMSEVLAEARASLSAFNAALFEVHPGAREFGDLDAEAQDDFLATQEAGQFFDLMWFMTIFGFFAMEKYGGNRDHVSWDLIGFEGHGAAIPPFGYYDAQYMAEHPEEDVDGN